MAAHGAVNVRFVVNAGGCCAGMDHEGTAAMTAGQGRAGPIATWVPAVLGDEVGSQPGVAELVERRAESVLASIDIGLADDLRTAARAARWLLPLLVCRLPTAARLSPERRDLALVRCVDPPWLLRPFATTLRGIARGIKLLVVFAYFTDDAGRAEAGYVEMDQRPRAHGLDLSVRTYREVDRT
jgi:hypothetical protein